MHGRPAILALGTALPPHRVAQDAAAELVVRVLAAGGERAAWVRRVFEHAGVAERRSVLPEVAAGRVAFGGTRRRGTAARMAAYREHAAPLAAGAARRALEGAGVRPAEVTHLVVVSCTGFYAPGVDADLLPLLGLRPDADRTLVGFMGCHGAFAGLRVARRAVEADARAVALVVAVELCTLHLRDDASPGSVVAHALFGDGAGAAVVASPRPESPALLGLGPAALRVAAGSAPLMGWEIGDDGFAMTLDPAVPSRLAAEVADFAAPLAAGGRVDAWCLHPGGPAILAAAARALGARDDATEASRAVLRDPGNVSSASILFVLERAAPSLRPGAKGVALGFGPGLTLEGFGFVRGARSAGAAPPLPPVAVAALP